MAILNDYSENTKSIIHILITELCNRNCKFCCNKQYDMKAIPFVTDDELKQAKILCLTGGEPFLFSNPDEIARYYKMKYKNIEKVYVYTNALELSQWLDRGNQLNYIDGVNVSIKVPIDVPSFNNIYKNPSVLRLTDNRLYVFDDLYKDIPIGWDTYQRQWQEEFAPATDSIFRRM